MATCLALVAGALGYSLGSVHPASNSILQNQQMPPFESYLAEESFSEVANTKGALQALVTEFLTGVRCRHQASASPAQAKLHPENPSYVVQPTLAIKELERGVEEFSGTGQEGAIQQELLWLLKQTKQYDHWLDVYLKALYRHPTQPLVPRLAKDAAWVSAEVDRQNELAQAFSLLAQIPPAFSLNFHVSASTQPVGTGPQDVAGAAVSP